MAQISLRLFILCLSLYPLSKVKAECSSAEYYCAWKSPKGMKPKETAKDESTKFRVDCCYVASTLQCQPCPESWKKQWSQYCTEMINTKHHGLQKPNSAMPVHSGCLL